MLLNRYMWFIVVIIAIYLSLFSVNAFGESHVKLVTMKDGSEYYYDKDSIKRMAGKVKVWPTVVFKGESLDNQKKSLQKIDRAKDLEKFSHVKTLHEINCRERKYRFLIFVHYDVDGKVLDTLREVTPWFDFVPGTVNDGLRGRVCK